MFNELSYYSAGILESQPDLLSDAILLESLVVALDFTV